MLFWHLLLSYLIYSVVGQSCPSPSTHFHDASCIAVSSWEDFSEAIRTKRVSKELVFCPFNVTKELSEPIVIKRTVSLLCREPGKCIMSMAKSRGGRFIKIKGSQAQVTVFGFVFMNAGDRSSGSLYSAIQICYRAGAGKKQLFCNCDFIGNKGTHRGVAIRAGAETHVSLINCTFEGNLSSSIGTVFNRGVMRVEKCIFLKNYGTGGAIGSSRKSTTVLKLNSFSNNSGGSPLLFHDFKNYVDSGGNVASGNDCNGIFILVGNTCTDFIASEEPTPSPSLAILSNPESKAAPASARPSLSPTIAVTNDHEDNISCNRLPKDIDTCIDIASFEILKELVKDASGMMVFCPFTFTKNEHDFVYITTNVELVCSIRRQCKIRGEGRHIIVNGSSAKLFVQGIVFEGATAGAIQIQSGTSHVQSFCDTIFAYNKGSERGLGILTERNTFTEVSHCVFLRCESSDMGGAIFNRGAMLIENTFFDGNIGQGGSIASAPMAVVRLKGNTIVGNRRGEPIFFHEHDVIDLGNNVIRGNTDCDCCDGVFLQREGKMCLPFSSLYTDTGVIITKPPTYSPAAPPNQSTGYNAPRGGSGYFNYSPADLQFGPNSWGDVRDNAEHLRYKEMKQTLGNRSLVNKCDGDSHQSPIDLCEQNINSECKEHHQTRTRSGSIGLGMGEVTAQILPSKLRLKYYPDRTPEGGPNPPKADFAHNWNGYIEVNHVDLKIPSEHSICGKKFPAELSIYLLHPLRRQTVAMSILMDFDPSDSDNHHFQKVIDKWQQVFDVNNLKCTPPPMKQSREFFNAADIIGDLPSSTEAVLGTSNHSAHEKYDIDNGTHRILNGSLARRDVWDPFHPEMERSLYHWGYWGSFTEPPCSTFVAWRVLTEPAFISKRQWYQLRKILFTNKGEQCEYTSFAHDFSVARPLQPFRGRDLHMCRPSDYVSDVEKERMKEESGNPNWCC